MKRKILLFFTILLLFVGIGIILYPTVSSYVNARTQSQIITEYEEIVRGLTEEEMAAILEEANAYNERLRTSEIVLTDPFDEEAQQVVSADYADTLNVDGNGLMGYIDIPSINVHLAIYHGTSSSVLSTSVGHLEGTSLPVGGEGTHAVLSAHTGLAEARLFTDLDTLEVGDTFTVTVLNEVMTYEVYSIDIVLPTDTSTLTIQEGEDLVTLVTCTPRNINSHRLLVHGTRIETPEETTVEEEVSIMNVVTFPVEYLVFGGAIAFIALLVLTFTIRKTKKRRRRIQKLWRQLRE